MNPNPAVMPKTDWVSMDEAAYVLIELVKKTPDSMHFHRYRHIQVIRNDDLAEYIWDMGDESKFKDNGFCIPGGGYDTEMKTFFTPQGPVQIETGPKFWHFEETVGRLIDAAEKLHLKPFDIGLILDNQTDLIAGYHEQIDRKQNPNKRQFAMKVKI